jgi:hypothetical protein
MRKWREIALVALVAVLLSVHSNHAPACGPYFERAVFSFDVFPQLEAPQLVAGQLGVLEPKYFRRFLFVAYRYLTDTPLTATEQEAFLKGPGQQATPNPMERWTNALTELEVEAPARISTYRKVTDSSWQYFQNCSPDAFRNAADTLEKRVEEFGADREGVRDWITAQQTVFSNCNEGVHIPAAAGAALPELLRKDRDYQIAAAHFYSLDLREAERRFRVIAADAASPWHTIAPYLTARCLIRRATLDPRPDLVDMDMLSRAAYELRQLLDDDSRAAVHPAARSMLEYLDARLMPGRRLAALSRDLSKPEDSPARFWRNLSDFQFLMDKNAAYEDGGLENELVAWIVNFQTTTDTARDDAVARWEQTKSPLWLVSAIAKVQAGDDGAPALLDAAGQLPADSPGWTTATYHRARLLIASGETEQARTLLDAALPGVQPTSAVNRFRAQRFKLSQSLDEFIRYSERTVIGSAADGIHNAVPPASSAAANQLDSDAVVAINRGLSLNLLSNLAEAENLSTPTRREIASAAYVRALLLKDYTAAKALAPTAGIPSSAGDEDSSFRAALLLLRHPGLRPYIVTGANMRAESDEVDNYRDNWWCSFDLGERLDVWPQWRAGMTDNGTGPPQPQTPEFVSDADRDQFNSEWNRLLALPTAPNLLSDAVIQYAQEHPDDPDVPEALHLAVRATRYGCVDGATSDYSKAAFRLLHRKYPNSEWTAKTPYHF